MARSDYVWLVRHAVAPGVVAVWTVKYEMVDWLRREIAAGPSLLPRCKVERMRNGQPHVEALPLGTVAEFLEKETVG